MAGQRNSGPVNAIFPLRIAANGLHQMDDIVAPFPVSAVVPISRVLKWLLRPFKHSASTDRILVVRSHYQIPRLRQGFRQEPALCVAAVVTMGKEDSRSRRC